jgi:hypothetical protein
LMPESGSADMVSSGDFGFADRGSGRRADPADTPFCLPEHCVIGMWPWATLISKALPSQR